MLVLAGGWESGGMCSRACIGIECEDGVGEKKTDRQTGGQTSGWSLGGVCCKPPAQASGTTSIAEQQHPTRQLAGSAAAAIAIAQVCVCVCVCEFACVPVSSFAPAPISLPALHAHTISLHTAALLLTWSSLSCSLKPCPKLKSSTACDCAVAWGVSAPAHTTQRQHSSGSSSSRAEQGRQHGPGRAGRGSQEAAAACQSSRDGTPSTSHSLLRQHGLMPAPLCGPWDQLLSTWRMWLCARELTSSFKAENNVT